MTASAKVGDTPAIPAPAAQIRITMEDEPGPPAPQPASLDIIQNSANKVGAIKNETARIALPSPPTQNTSSAFTSLGLGAAPAPAKKMSAAPAKEKENKKIEWEPAIPAHDASPILSSVSVSTADSPSFSPSFAGLSGEEDSGGSGGSRKILIVAVIVLALATLGYMGYAKLGKSTTATPAPQVNTPSDSGKQDSTQPAPAPMSSANVAPSPSTPNRASSATQTASGKTATVTSPDIPSSGAATRPETRIALDSGLEAKKPNSTPLFVKSNAPGTKTQAPSPDSAPALPSPLAVAPPNDSALSGLMSSASSSFSKPSLATPRVSQGVSQGLLIKRVDPKYPQAALAVHAHGAVQIEATINKDGNVTNLKVLSGHPVLAHAALEAVRQWRYKPYYLDGEPIEIQTQITVNFKAN